MAKRAWPFEPRSGTLARTHAGFTPSKRARGASTFQKGRGRFAGYKAYRARAGDAGPELKFHDGTMTDASVATGGIILLSSLNAIPQDVTEDGRIGRKVVLRSFGMRYRITLPEQDAGATPPPDDTLRMMIILDKQCNGLTATVTGDNGPMEQTDQFSFNDLGNKSRFLTLIDRTHDIAYTTLASDGAGLVSAASVSQSYSVFKKLTIPLEFSGADGLLDKLRSNNIFCLMYSQNSQVAFDSRFRFRYSDAS